MGFGKNVLLKSVIQIRVLRPAGDGGYYSLKKHESRDYQVFLQFFIKHNIFSSKPLKSHQNYFFREYNAVRCGVASLLQPGSYSWPRLLYSLKKPES